LLKSFWPGAVAFNTRKIEQLAGSSLHSC